MSEEITDGEYDQAKDELGAFLESIAGKIRPKDIQYDEEGEEMRVVETNSLIQEWMVLMTWTDMNTGDSYTNWVSSNMLPSHQMGLLMMVLDTIRQN